MITSAPASCTEPTYEMSEGAWPTPELTVWQWEVCKKEGGLLCCLAMAKQLLNLMSGKALWRPCVSREVCKEEGGLLWCMTMAKQLWNDAWQGPG
jgi:hypothetical protein